MMILVSYDVAEDEGGKKRLRHIAKICENYGQRVQYSVFECLVDPAQWEKLKQELIDKMNPDYDSLRFYFLGANWQNRVEHIGAKKVYNPEGPLMI
ncbi:MAG: CRISPR-associated endonuclease Cas2 [Athalassotoga sp.]|uniref:CRISPR-associated endonuclease Cas2 n=2 Tax=Athalassotoga sp. TaxID=2022597 RepID=UPI003D08D522